MMLTNDVTPFHPTFSPITSVTLDPLDNAHSITSFIFIIAHPTPLPSNRQYPFDATPATYASIVPVTSRNMPLLRTASTFNSPDPITRMNELSLSSPTTASQQQAAQQHNQVPLASPDYHREAQQIVKEEREQREKMPSYPVSD
jgi:hypothetical protein